MEIKVDEDTHFVLGHCWLCDDEINLVGARKVRIAEPSEMYPNGAEGAICTKDGCQAWADDRDGIHGEPILPEWPEKLDIPVQFIRT